MKRTQRINIYFRGFKEKCDETDCTAQSETGIQFGKGREIYGI